MYRDYEEQIENMIIAKIASNEYKTTGKSHQQNPAFSICTISTYKQQRKRDKVKALKKYTK